MIDVLEFIFKDFWHFIGTVIILGIIFDGMKGFITINKTND